MDVAHHFRILLHTLVLLGFSFLFAHILFCPLRRASKKPFIHAAAVSLHIASNSIFPYDASYHLFHPSRVPPSRSFISSFSSAIYIFGCIAISQRWVYPMYDTVVSAVSVVLPHAKGFAVQAPQIVSISISLPLFVRRFE